MSHTIPHLAKFKAGTIEFTVLNHEMTPWISAPEAMAFLNLSNHSIKNIPEMERRFENSTWYISSEGICHLLDQVNDTDWADALDDWWYNWVEPEFSEDEIEVTAPDIIEEERCLEEELILQLLKEGKICRAIEMMEMKVFSNRAPILSLEITPICPRDPMPG